MKKILFYTSLIVSVFFLINIISIIYDDFVKLTEYGYGYLTGKIIIFILFVLISYFTRKTVFIKHAELQ